MFVKSLWQKKWLYIQSIGQVGHNSNMYVYDNYEKPSSELSQLCVWALLLNVMKDDYETMANKVYVNRTLLWATSRGAL